VITGHGGNRHEPAARLGCDPEDILVTSFFGIEIVTIYYCISIHSLQNAAKEVGVALAENGPAAAREKLSRIVGRDVYGLGEAGIPDSPCRGMLARQPQLGMAGG
jgi:hypothetical protein